MLRSRLIGLALLALGVLVLFGCGEVEYIDACQGAASAEACMDCCVDAGFTDWSYNASYSPPCGCIE